MIPQQPEPPLDMIRTPNPRIRSVAKFFFESDKKFFVKGITYGPFKPDAEGNYLGRPEQVEADLAHQCQIGIDLLRLSEIISLRVRFERSVGNPFNKKFSVAFEKEFRN